MAQTVKTTRGWLAMTFLAGVMAAGGAAGVQRLAAPAPQPPALSVVPAGLASDVNPDRAAAGTDNAPLIQAAIDQAQAAGLPVELPPGRYKVASTLRIDGAVNFTFGGSPSGRQGPDDMTRGTWLVWAGPPGGTVVSLRGIKCRLHDLGIACCRDTSVQVCVDVESPASYPGLSSQHLFERVACYGMAGPVSVGWQVGADGRPNNEFHLWRDCSGRYCSYAVISVPSGTFQCKNLAAEHCTFSGAGAKTGCYGVAFATGSMCFRGCSWDSCGVAARWFGGGYEPVLFEGCTGESNGAFLWAGGLQQVGLTGCRLSLNAAPSPQALGQEFLSGGANWSVRACAFEDGDAQNGFFRPGNGGTVCLDGCVFQCDTPLSTDGQTTWRGSFRNVRVSQGNNMVPDGPGYQRFVPNLLHGGNGLLLDDGRYPVNAAFGGGTPKFGAGTCRLFYDSGKLWASLDGGAAREVQLQMAP